jgi:hypothetical protein
MSNERKCEACGGTFIDHLGLVGTCAKLQGAQEATKLATLQRDCIMSVMICIAELGGKEFDGASCNGSWCAEQARSAIENYKRIGKEKK